MGQVCKVVFISLIFTLMPLSLHGGWGEGAQEQWERFYSQYRSLLHDGKTEAAERLLHSRWPDMETYMSGVSEEDRAVWEDLNMYQDGDRPSEAALLFFEVITAPDRETAVEQKLAAFREGLSSTPAEQVLLDWEDLEPVVMHVYDSVDTKQLREALEQHHLQPTTDTAASASAMVDAFVQGTDEGVSLTGMAAGVGGFILAVLFYVGVRKHPSRSKIRHTIKEHNS